MFFGSMNMMIDFYKRIKLPPSPLVVSIGILYYGKLCLILFSRVGKFDITSWFCCGLCICIILWYY